RPSTSQAGARWTRTQVWSTRPTPAATASSLSSRCARSRSWACPSKGCGSVRPDLSSRPSTHKNKMKDRLSTLIARRHPRYEELKPHWDFLEATYEGGRAWFKDNIFRYIKEGDSEYA